jgi:hypothetical protein
MSCQEKALTRGVWRPLPFEGWTLTYVRGSALPARFSELLDEGNLQLVEGRWRITASLRNSVGPCGSVGVDHALQASVDIEVAG